MTQMNKWTSYLEGTNSKKVISLEDIGLDFKVTVRNMSVYTPVQIHEMITKANHIAVKRMEAKTELYEKKRAELQARVNNEEDEYTEDQMYLELDDLSYSEPTGLNTIHVLLILEWNITDPETGEILPIPTDDPQVLFKIPVGVQTYIREQLDAFIEDPESIVPKVSETS